MPKAVEFRTAGGYSAIWLIVLYCIGVLAKRVKLFEKYADITVCEDNQKLEDTIESVLDALGE